MTMPDSDLLNVRETAKRLGVHENTVRNWVRQGLLKDSRVPGSRFHRFRVQDVERLVSQRGSAADTLQTERRNANPELVGASQLAQWPASRSRDAQATFPELFRRLVGETPGATVIALPSGDGVSTPGLDGVVDLTEATTYLPAGRLLIELGTDSDPKRKASEEYKKRVGPGLEDSVFVFATPRRWPGAQTWAEQRRGESRFRDVRVIDASQLESWLQDAPSAHHWISEHLGLRPRDAITLDTWWYRLSTSTQPMLPLGLCTSGRTSEADELRRLLAQDEPRLTSVECEWSQDGIGFVHAAVRLDGPLSLSPSPLVVSSAEVWDRIVDRPGRAILLPQFENADVDAALNAGHHVIAIIDSSNARRRAVDISLPRLGRAQAREAFERARIDWPQADRLAALARRSFPALVRTTSLNPQVRQPAWAQPNTAQLLAPLVLAGTWRSRPGDQQVLARLAGRRWDELEDVLLSASAGPDPLFRQVDQHWGLASPEEAYLVLGDRLSSGAVQRWREVVREVLLASDPFHQMSDTERLVAQLQGVGSAYSTTLKGGLAQGVAMIGAISEGMEGSSLVSASEADRIVRDLMGAASADTTGRTWVALASALPLLAEGAPDAFLDCLDDELANSAPSIGALFVSSGDGLSLGPTTRHSSLLWALEQLCWTPMYLVRAAQVLTRLSRFDLPANAGNTPLNSLSSSLCGWIRNTDAGLNERLDAIDAVRAANIDIGWDLIMRLWPSHHATSFPPSRPRFRMVGAGGRDVPTNEWLAFVDGLIDRAIAWSSEEPSRLPALIDRISNVPPSGRDRFLEHLEHRSRSAEVELRLTLFDALQTLVSTHEEHETADWALPHDVRARLARLRDAMEPIDDMRKLAYLFDWHPVLPGFSRREFDAYRAELQRQRMSALEAVFDGQEPFATLADIASRAKAPGQLGYCLEQLGLPEESVLDWLFSGDEALIEVAHSFMYRRLYDDDGTHLSGLLRDRTVNADQIAALVRCIPAAHPQWQVLRDYPAVQDAYWATADLEVVDPQDARVAIEQLLKHERPWPAIAVAAHALDDPASDGRQSAPGGLTTDLLRSVVLTAFQTEPRPGDIGQMTTYYLENVLDFLDTHHGVEDDLVQLELWTYQLMEHRREPRALNRALASNPQVFVDLTEMAFRAKNERAGSTGDRDGNATLAMSVIQGWSGYPGRAEGGALDATQMLEWVLQARLLLSDVDRADIGDELIGQALAHSPEGPDGVWPQQPVRHLVETIGSRELENGLIIGRLNRRGVTTRSVYDGGQIERREAARYREWAAAVQGKSPRTARVLRSIAESLERDAQHEDRRAEIDQDRD